METPAITLRQLQETDIEAALQLSTDAGWNQTEKDWKFLLSNPRNICLTVEYDLRIIATTVAINYANRASWISMVLVDKAFRGQGLSKLLLTNILEKLSGFTSVKLDATPEGQPVYKRLDFQDEYLIARMVNMSVRPMTPGDASSPETVQPENMQHIVALDEDSFGVNRSSLISLLVKEHPGMSWLLKQNDHITGFITGRDGRNYHQLGPLVASTTNDAKILITKALNLLTHQSVVVDVPYDKTELIEWLKTIGFTKQRHFTRMYKKENPFPGIPCKQFLICGPEFG